MEGDKKIEYEKLRVEFISASVSVNGIEKSSMQLQFEPVIDGADVGAVEQTFACCQL